MTLPRSQLVSVDDTPYYHLVSRCVRQRASETPHSCDEPQPWRIQVDKNRVAIRKKMEDLPVEI